jgi:hypothetical protein
LGRIWTGTTVRNFNVLFSYWTIWTEENREKPQPAGLLPKQDSNLVRPEYELVALRLSRMEYVKMKTVDEHCMRDPIQNTWENVVTTEHV